MDEALRFFHEYEGVIYVILGVGALVNLRLFIVSWQELRSTIYGLEREQAQTRLNQAAGVLTMLILFAVVEFVTVSFIIPMRPQANPLLTPTIDLLASPTITLPPANNGGEANSDGDATPTPVPTPDLRQGVCLAKEAEITSPQPGDRVSGEISILGFVNVENFGFYKLEIAPNQSVNWRTIQAGRDLVKEDNGVLVQQWDTSTLQAGDYILRLVVTLSDETALPDCRVPITILPPE
ncbi:MAG: hypothetical protein H6636_06315 [Anaerolineales bacterium]|nr:hypothetical protein [Anaerolineales bacterium]